MQVQCFSCFFPGDLAEQQLLSALDSWSAQPDRTFVKHDITTADEFRDHFLDLDKSRIDVFIVGGYGHGSRVGLIIH